MASRESVRRVRQRAMTAGSASRSLSGRRAVWGALVCAAILVGLAGGVAVAQVSGRFGLDLVARRIPSSLTDDLVLDTPSEFAVLQFGLASYLDLTFKGDFVRLSLDAATNMAGPEHAVAIGELDIAPFPLAGLSFEDVHLACEMWFAVPFEAVTDVNNLPNSVVIPPADPLFVTARLITSFTVAGFRVKHQLMVLDVDFPNPNAEFAPLFYEATDQDFSCGSFLAVSWSAQLGLSLSLTLGCDASLASTSVKGYSAGGRVDPGNWFLNGSASGIRLCDLPIGFAVLTNCQIGISFSVSSLQTLSASLAFSARVMEGVGLSASMTLLRGPHEIRGLNLSGSLACFQFGMSLEKLEVTSLSMGCNTPFSLGATTGSIDVRLTGLERGLTGISSRLTIAQGVFSASTSVAFAQRGSRFGFGSLSTQLTFRFSPGTLSFQATFGRYGMTRASTSVGVTF